MKKGNARARNIAMWLYVACLYLFDGLFWASLYTGNEIVFIVSMVFGVLSFPFLFVTIGLAIYKIAFPDPDSLRFSLIVKLAMIPYFCSNFVICLLILVGLVNPFLILAIPIVFIIVVSLTFLCLCATSANAVAYMIRKAIEKEIPLQAAIVNCILHFCFVLDVISSVYVYFKFGRKKKMEKNPDIIDAVE